MSLGVVWALVAIWIVAVVLIVRLLSDGDDFTD
jgi:hypothetical protein